MNVQYLKIKEIREDFFFCFTTLNHPHHMENSIRLSGIQTPLRVISGDSGFQLLSGFKRFVAAKKIGLKQIPVSIVPDSAVIDAFHQTVAEQLTTVRAFTLIEKSRILNILEKLGVKQGRVKSDFLPLLELSPKNEILNAVTDLLTLDPKVQTYIEMYDLSEKQCRIFKKLTSDEQAVFAELGFQLQIRAVELLEIITIIMDISGRDSHGPLGVYKELGIESILKDTDMTRNDKITAVKTALRAARFPRIQTWNRQLDMLNKKLNLPAGMILKWDPVLEKSGLICRMQIDSVEVLRNATTVFSDERNMETIQKMLDIV